MVEIGRSLQEARERKGLELAQVAAETRIRASYLAALENERFDALPGRAYARAFLREYAEHLGLDGQRLLDEYDARFPDFEEPPLAPARLPQPLRLKPYAAAGAGLAALLLLGLLAWHSGGGDRTTAIPTAAPPPPPTTETVTAPATQKPPAQAKLVLRASGRCWLEVHLGSREGRTVYTGTLEAGERARFVARRLWIRLGAPWNLTATLNDKRVSLPGRTANVLVTPRGIEPAQDGQAPPLETTASDELGGSFRGELLLATSRGYDTARRVWNGAIDRHPAYIARCTGVADVVAAVRFARDHALEIAVRGGGHNVAGTAVCDDGIVIDLSAMRAVWVDPAGRTARVQGGALWGDVDHETQAHGLATTGGIVGHTGVAGLTLGGGIGFLMRKHGLTVDNLLAAEVVTADGRIVRASADEHPDLFWALRGGGGNFGVVTSFRFALHPLGPTVMAGPVFWAADDTTDVLRFYRDFAAEAPDELGSVVRLGTVPPLPDIPEDLHWRPAVAVACCYAGAVEDGERAVRALRRFGAPLVDLISPTPYVTFQGGLDDTVLHGWHYYWKATNLAGLSDDAIAVIADHAFAAGSPRSYTAMFHMGGAVARVPHDATAYAARDVAHNIVIDAVWLPDESGAHAAAETAWARRFLQALQPHRAGGVYVNFLDSDDDSTRVREAYGDQIYRRLAEVKAKYDPDNAFHHNKNIQPG